MLSENTRVSLAEVANLVDPNRNGTFQARIFALNKIEKPVRYVSPYGSLGEGAFVAIPEEGTEILVCQPEGSDSWYYMGTTFSPEPKETTGDPIPDSNIQALERVDPLLYSARGIPMKKIFKSQSGTGIVIADEYAPEGIMDEDGYVNRKLELNTVNKKITLTDSPAQDSIVLDTGNGSRLMLTDYPKDDEFAARALEVQTVGPQKYINLESQTDIVVSKAGRELQLINNGNGEDWGEDTICGNVNLQSKWKDVNVFTQAEEGRIFIECLNENGSNQVIQIETNGTGGAIVIKTKGDIRLDAGQNIDLTAGGEIRMKSGSSFSVDSGGSIEAKSAGSTNIDGSQVQLNGGLAAPSTPSTQGEQSYYDNEGITTY